MVCLHCGANPAAGERKFCSPACRAEFARTMPESVSCSNCDTTADGVAEATAAGWIDIEPDPEGPRGTTWGSARTANGRNERRWPVGGGEARACLELAHGRPTPER